MKISGFTFARNTAKLYYPIRASILSILPIVDEFVVALGDCSPDDTTRELIESIDSPKIKIIDTVWDIEKYPRGMEHAHQTDIAMKHCSGDWLFYLQADEVIHEQYLPIIVKRCEDLLEDREIDGLLFRYKHFYGDYNHIVVSHGWYPNEMRIVRNDPTIHSYISAQSFRRIPNFDGVSYRQKKGTERLKVARIEAYVYHYGWVRPPRLMQDKSKAFNTTHLGKSEMENQYKDQPDYFDYGPMKLLTPFTESHPEVMKDKIATFDWAHQLNYEDMYEVQRPKMKHERLKYKILTFFEQNFNGGQEIFGYSNWRLVKR